MSVRSQTWKCVLDFWIIIFLFSCHRINIMILNTNMTEIINNFLKLFTLIINLTKGIMHFMIKTLKNRKIFKKLSTAYLLQRKFRN